MCLHSFVPILHVCLFLCVFVFCFVDVCPCLCVGQGGRHAAVCRPAVFVNGGTADDTAAADGGGSEVAGAGGKAAGNTQNTPSRELYRPCVIRFFQPFASTESIVIITKSYKDM